jgi:putative ABC transport system permease protein
MIKKKDRFSILGWIINHLKNTDYNASRLSVVGDLLEESKEVQQESGTLRAGWWRFKQICLLLPAYFFESMLWKSTMIWNYAKSSLRNFKNHKIYALINISGLSIGICLFLLIALFVYREYQVDRFHEFYHRIYRIETSTCCVMPPGVGHLLQGQLPEIQETIRFHLMRDEDILFQQGSRMHTLKYVAFADEGVFDVFTFPFVKGDPKTALNSEFSIVLTESVATQIFGSVDPIGKVLQTENNRTFTISGVITDVKDSHFPISAIASFASIGKMWGQAALTRLEDGWQHPTFLLLPEKHDAFSINTKINSFFKEQNVFSDTPTFKLRPLSQVYLAGESIPGDNYQIRGSPLFIRIFTVIAFFILLIASVNFVNLSTAKASQRSREVGVKKVVGASRKQLISQFLLESQITIFISLGVGLILAELILPFFSRAIGTELSLRVLLAFPFPLICVACSLILGFLAGSYPAFYLSGFTSASVKKNILTHSGGNASLRKALTVFQFTLATALIIATLTVSRQLEYMKTAELGFQKDHILTLPLNSFVDDRKEAFKQELLRSPLVSHVAFSCRIPGESMWTWGNINEKKTSIPVNAVDPDFFNTYGIEVIEGRNFAWSRPADHKNAVVLNESAVKFFNFSSPLGQELKGLPNHDGKGRVIGVVKDFHFNSLHTRIRPTIFYWEDWPHSRISVKIAGFSPQKGRRNLAKTIAHIRGIWEEFSPAYPFEIKFLDESFDRQYKAEERLSQLFIGFALLAIFISCLGLFGLVSYTTEKRTKEIGIRKVLGATASGILIMLGGQFLRWILAANIFAWPLGYLFLRGWLRNFAYRTGVDFLLFLFAGVLSLLIAGVTIGYQAAKASKSDPIISLRYE